MEFVELIYIYQRLGDTTLTGFLFFWAEPPSGSCFVVIVACCVTFFGVCVYVFHDDGGKRLSCLYLGWMIDGWLGMWAILGCLASSSFLCSYFFFVIGRTGNIDSTTYIFHTLWYLEMMVHKFVTIYPYTYQ